MLKRIALYYNTIKYLKTSQILYRLYYFILNKIIDKTIDYSKNHEKKYFFLTFYNSSHVKVNYIGNNEFIFLNIKHVFFETINWDFKQYGILWTYNLCYFDFLNQNELSVDEGLRLINNFIDFETKTGNDSYPLSLRVINWIKFLSKHNIQSPKIANAIYLQCNRLINRIEYDTLGNHLIENGMALYWASYFFKDQNFYNKSKNIILKELKEQILADGGHFELSPMYHQIILHRVLECLYLESKNVFFKDDEFKENLTIKATLMLSWIEQLTFSNNQVPNVNDSDNNIAINIQQIRSLAQLLGIKPLSTNLKESGYRLIRKKKYECFIDIGTICSSYQPAHTHSDIFNFLLNVNNVPLIVEVGISTYEKNKRRHLERSTKSHNTVIVNETDPIETWSSFRVAKRAKVDIISEEDQVEYIAKHDGYKKTKLYHTRHFKFQETKIHIGDYISKSSLSTAVYHFPPNQKINLVDNVIFLADVTITFNNYIKIDLEEYSIAIGFNKLEKAQMVTIKFLNKLETIIELIV